MWLLIHAEPSMSVYFEYRWHNTRDVFTYLCPNLRQSRTLTHWGRVTHICVSKLSIIGSDNGLSPGRRQAIIWTNDGILLIRTLGTNFSEILSKIHSFSFKEMHLKMSSGKWRPFCLGLNVLKETFQISVMIYRQVSNIRRTLVGN